MSNKLFLFATIRLKPAHVEAARAALDALMPLTLAEPGCHMFAAFAAQNSADTLHLVECFDDEAALESHYAQAYTRDVFTAYEDWLAAPVEVTRMTPLSATSARQLHG